VVTAGSSDLVIAPPPELLAAAIAGGPGDLLAGIVADQILAGGAPPELIESAPPRPLPVLAREPLAGGALAGAIGPGMTLPPRDDRNALDAATLDRIALARRAMARLAPLVRHPPPAASATDAARAVLERSRSSKLDREASTVAELALRYVLDRGALALPRLHRREHLGETLGVLAAPPLSPAALERLEHALDQRSSAE
jgi:aryl-alcohol dehydrogenase-like predicted oxidoreductase